MPVRLEVSGGVGTIVLDRPNALNALDVHMVDQLEEAWEEVTRNEAVRVVVLTGAGDRAFCAGADLKTLLPIIFEGGFENGLGPRGNVFAKSVPLFKPVVAAINGDAVAGGTELLQAADLRVAVETARFGLAEVRWSLMAAGGSTVRLPRQIAYCRAMEILMLGRLITAEEALDWGLINKVVSGEDLAEAVDDYVQVLLRNGSLAMAATKESVVRSLGRPLEDAYVIESALARRLYASEDSQEGPRAFIEKRDPVYRGR
jgi:enoyl-CoA hydratase/carnithine racemase